MLEVGRYDFDDVVGLAFDQLRRASFTSGQVAVLERLLEVIERVLAANKAPDRKQALWDRAFAVGRLAPDQVTDPRDAMRLTRKAAKIGVSLLEAKLGAVTETTVNSDLEELVRLTVDLPGGQRVRDAMDGVRKD